MIVEALLLAHVNAAHWADPLGWLYRNTPGNLAAGGIQVVLTAIAASLLWPPLRRRIHKAIDNKLSGLHAHLEAQAAHRKWEAELLAKMHLASTGEHAPDHPEHGALTAPPSTAP